MCIRDRMIDMAEKGMSKGEFTNVKQAVGGVEALIDENCRDKDLLALLKYLSPEDREEKILLNPQVCLLYTSLRDPHAGDTGGD